MTPHGTVCRAPSTSMYLDPLGVVRPCCVNPYYVLGRVGESSLAEIWHGAQTRELRERLAVGDLSGGCDSCASAIDAGNPDGAFARTFDDLPAGGGSPELQWPAQLELALSNTCNLQCTMCSGTLSSAIRAGREGLAPLPAAYDDEFFEQLRPFLAHVERISFLGGEPLLARETWRVVDLLDSVGGRPRIQVTTNGTIWNSKVERLLASHPTDVVVSIDAIDPERMAAIRVGIDPHQVLEGLARFKDHAVANRGSLALAHCLMVESLPDLYAVLLLADGLDVDVFLNEVSWPAASALWSLDQGERADALAQLDAQATAGPPLGRNLEVFHEARRRLRASPRSEPAEVALEVPTRSLGPKVTFTVDGQHQLVRVDPDPTDVFGVDVTALLGGPVGEWREAFHAVHGSLRRSHVQRGEGGEEIWTLDVGPAEAARRLRAEFKPDAAGGGSWHLTMRGAAPQQV